MYATLCARRTQLIQRRRCVTCVSPALLVDSAQHSSARVRCARRCVPPPERGLRAGIQQGVRDTAVESPDLKSRQLVIT
ncbi:unnamed protein product [Ectocarpus sp. 12 AP-2014]